MKRHVYICFKLDLERTFPAKVPTSVATYSHKVIVCRSYTIVLGIHHSFMNACVCHEV